jgi:hypothetical protein
MTNGLVAAVYTNGLLRIVRLSDCTIVHQMDLLSDFQASKKVFDAKICSKTF